MSAKADEAGTECEIISQGPHIFSKKALPREHFGIGGAGAKILHFVIFFWFKESNEEVFENVRVLAAKCTRQIKTVQLTCDINGS